jgi:hypothetical protein
MLRGIVRQTANSIAMKIARPLSAPSFILLSFTLALLLSAATAQAKELYGRTGLGYNAQFSQTTATNGVAAISLKYGIAPRTMIEIIAGFYSGNDGSGVAALKFMRTIHSESYANFYFLLGAGLVSANHRSGQEFLGGLGTEFFIPGVDSVGISFEAGLSAENLTAASETFVLKTFGVSFLNAGMHFYF